MRTHHISIIPTVHKELNPYNYKRIKRFSRMSGKSEQEVEQIFKEEYAKLKPQPEQKNDHKETRYIDDSKFDRTLLSQLYNRVMERLGIANESLSFVMESRVHGFNLERSEKYLLDIGYSKKFVDELKTSPEITLIHYPKYLDSKYKKSFEYYFEKKILGKNYQIEHPIVFYARTLAGFITHLYEAKKNPFSKIVTEAKSLPISALQSLYKYKFDVVLRYVKTLDGFKFDKFQKASETFDHTEGRMSNFVSYGEVVLKASDFKTAIKNLKIGAKLQKGNKLHFRSEKGVDLIMSLDGDCLLVKYRIKIDTHFRTYGTKDVRNWIKSFVVKPCLKPSISLRHS